MRKGQATPFIIVGIIVVILVVIVVFISKPTAIGGRLRISQVQPVKNYIDECIKNGADEKLEDLRKYGGYFSKSPLNIDDISILTVGKINDEIAMEYTLNEILASYLISECKIEEVFDEFSINTKNPEVKTDINDETVNVDVNWDITIRKGVESIKLNEFNYIKKEDVGWINKFIVPKIVKIKKLPVKTYFDDDGKDRLYYKEDGKINVDGESKEGYQIYYIKTRFDNKEGLDAFIFAIEK